MRTSNQSSGESVPRSERQVISFVCVVDGSLEVDDDGVVARDFGGNVDGNHPENRVTAEGERSVHKAQQTARRQRSAVRTAQTGTPARPPRP